MAKPKLKQRECMRSVIFVESKQNDRAVGRQWLTVSLFSLFCFHIYLMCIIFSHQRHITFVAARLSLFLLFTVLISRRRLLFQCVSNCITSNSFVSHDFLLYFIWSKPFLCFDLFNSHSISPFDKQNRLKTTKLIKTFVRQFQLEINLLSCTCSVGL